MIRQEVLHIHMAGAEHEGYALQQRMISLHAEKLVRTLENAFDRHSPKEGHLYIECLDLDLGEIKLEELDQRLFTALEEKLENYFHEVNIAQLMHQDNSPGRVSTEVIRYSDEKMSALQAFTYFLKSGRLPWHYALPQHKTLEKVLFEVWAEERKDVLLHHLTVSLNIVEARQRLVLQFSPAFIEMIIQLFTLQGHAVVLQLLHSFKNQVPEKTREKIYIAAIDRIMKGYSIFTKEELLNATLHLLQNDASPMAQSDLAILLEDNAIQFEKPIARHAGGAHAKKDSSISPHASLASIEEDETAFYIENAGLVILHPFLERLFEGTGIAQNNVIVDPDRALHLLHYLCTGQHDAPEYELTFSKILCGLPLTDPVSIHFHLPETDVAEADALLAAVIQHWTTLQNTSADGLRGSFLLRPGKIIPNASGDYRLQVEHRSYDILLDQLPWGISTIKLPWMPGFLHVEWDSL